MASRSGDTGVEVSTGRFGFCTLVGSAERPSEVECFVAASESDWSIILVPVTTTVSESEWSSGAAAGAASTNASGGAVLPVSGLARGVEVMKVVSGAVRALAQTRTLARQFEPRPTAQALMTAFYGSEAASATKQAELQASNTDEGRRCKGGRVSNPGPRGESRSGARASASPRRRVQEHLIGTSEEDDFGSEDLSEDVDAFAEAAGLTARLRHFSFDEAATRRQGRDVPGPRERPDQGLSESRSALAPGRDRVRGEAPGSRSRGSVEAGPRLRRANAQFFDDDEPDDAGQEAQPAPRRRRRAVEIFDDDEFGDGVQDAQRARHRRPRASSSRALELQMQMEMLKLIKEMRGGGGGYDRLADDAPEGNELDGLRVVRNLGRMRALKGRLRSQPNRIYTEFRERWVDELGAEGRPWKWTDRNKAIRWKKFASIRRADWMMSNILESLDRGETAIARAQVVQCMKAFHEFTNFGTWRAAWPMTFMTDPLERYQNGGDEVEMETVLGWLRTKDDLRAKMQKSTKELVSGDEGEAPVEQGGADRGTVPKKVKKPKGAGKGQKDEV